MTNFYRNSQQKQHNKWRGKVPSRILAPSADRSEIEFKVACDAIESVEFGKIYGFSDVTSNPNSISKRSTYRMKLRFWTFLDHEMAII